MKISKLLLIAYIITAPICHVDSRSIVLASRSEKALSDSLTSLDKRYGQGKFNMLSDISGTAWLLPDGMIRLQMPGDEVRTLYLKDLSFFLKNNSTSCNRMTIDLSELTGPILEISRPLVEICNKSGFRSIVVKDERQRHETYYSTYKFARIYSNVSNDYELDHNGLTFLGSAKDIAGWISILGIESVAFYPDENMPWTDAALIMNAEKARGGRSFSICTPMTDKAVPAIKTKERESYITTFIPSDLELTDKQKNGTLMEVERMLSHKLTDDCLKDAIKVVKSPKVFFNADSETRVVSAAFQKDEFILVLSRKGLGRNTWYKPDMNTCIIANGKKYRLIKDEGFEDFSRYPYVPEYGYANGCLCWVPERGTLYNTLHFEPIPTDVNSIDMTGTREYYFYGIQLGDVDEHKNTEVINQLLLSIPIELPGTKGNNRIIINRIEQSSDETVIGLLVLINADFTYPAHFGNDFELGLINGSKVKAKRIEGVPENKDYLRAGDQVIEYPRLVFPKIPEEQLRKVALSGTICHTKINIKFSYKRPDPLLAIPL